MVQGQSLHILICPTFNLLFDFDCILLSIEDGIVLFGDVSTVCLSVLCVLQLKGDIGLLASKQISDEQYQVDQDQY